MTSLIGVYLPKTTLSRLFTTLGMKAFESSAIYYPSQINFQFLRHIYFFCLDLPSRWTSLKLVFDKALIHCRLPTF